MNNYNFKDLLNSRNLKATNSRLELLDNMKSYKTAIPYSELQKSMKSIDRVTLYRTLETLLNQGIIHQAFRENNEIYYALCGSKCDTQKHHHNHFHFKCSDCEAVTCQELKNEVQIILPKHEIHKISINVEGVCELCLDKD